MAYKRQSLAIILRGVDNTLNSIKGYLQDRVVALGNGTTADLVLHDLETLRRADATLDTAAAVPGFRDYYRNEKNDGTADPIGDIQAIRTAISSTITWITDNLPKDGDGYLLVLKAGTTAVTYRTFPPAAVSQYRTSLQAIEALIE